MSGSVTPIQNFMVSLGYSVNGSQQRAFNNSLAAAAARFASLGLVSSASAAALVASVLKMTESLDKLYFQSMRTKASADNLSAFGYAAGQMGSSFDAAAGSIENLAGKLRRLPGMGAMLHNMGIAPGGDPVEMVSKLAARFKNSPMWLQLQYADLFGIDEKTWLAASSGKMGAFMQQRKQTAAAMGVNTDDAAKAANQLATSFRSLTMTLELFYQKLIQTIGGRVAASINRFRELIVANSERIIQVVMAIVQWFSTLGEVLVKLIARTIQVFQLLTVWFKRFWGMLDESQKFGAKVFAGLLIAWRLLNSAFLMSPLGRFLAILTAIMLLVDDYMTYKEHGKEHSLFNWAAWDEELKFIGEMFTWLGKKAKESFQWLIDLVADIKKWLPASMTSTGATAGGTDIGADLGQVFDEEGTVPGNWLERHIAPLIHGVGERQERGNGTLDGVAGKMAAEWRRIGVPDAQIAGLLSNASAESGFKMGSAADHMDSDGLLHQGIFQWSPERAKMFETVMKTPIKDATAEQQAQFIIWETKLGGEARNASAFWAAKTARDAAASLSRDVIRPGNKEREMANRGDLAQNFYAAKLRGSGMLTLPDMKDRVGTLGGPGSYADQWSPVLGGPALGGNRSFEDVMSGLRGNNVTMQQSTTINVNGSSDPGATADRVKQHQDNTNKRALRNTVGALDNSMGLQG